MTSSIHDNEETLLQAYCDGELDPSSAAALERRMQENHALKAQYEQIMHLRRALRALPQDEMPAQLSARIKLVVNAERSHPVRGWSWQALAASAVIGAFLSGAVMTTVERYSAREEAARQIVAGHIRSLLAPQPFDIASSDRHTVKPWFTTRIPESPQVVDLTSQGFILAGGRIDVLDRDPVPTIVYRHAAHNISLMSLKPDQKISDQAIAGYNIISWTDGNFTYVAVSDLPHEDLVTFEHAFAAASAAK